MTYKRISPIDVPSGGTGNSTITAYAPLCGGTTSSGALQVSTGSAGSSNQLMASGGPSALSAWVSTDGVTTGGASSVLMVDASNKIGTVPGGTETFNTGTQSLSISSDAAATTINIATGGAVKGVTLGSTNTTSSTAINSGTGNIACNSGLTVSSSGARYNTAQPAFSAYLSSSTANNKIGNGSTFYTVLFDTKIFDQATNYTTATGIFTAPIAGKYMFIVQCTAQGVVNANMRYIQGQLVTTGRTFYMKSATVNVNNPSGYITTATTVFTSMAANDTASFRVYGVYLGNSQSIGIVGSASPYYTYFSGFLVC